MNAPLRQMLSTVRFPIGSLVVDGALVLYLAFYSGQMTTRFEAMDARLMTVEQRESTEKLAQRTAILEQQIVQANRDRTEILEALHRIEARLEGKADRPR